MIPQDDDFIAICPFSPLNFFTGPPLDILFSLLIDSSVLSMVSTPFSILVQH